MPKERGLEIAAAFFSASRNGDMAGLHAILAADVALYADGGGKRPAANRPIVGLDEVMRFHASLAHLFAENPSRIARYAFINGLPGFVTIERDRAQTTALAIEGDRIIGIYVMRNPDKLRRLEKKAIH